ASNAAMQLYKAQVKKFEGTADSSDGIVAYGWTTAALFAKILEASPKLTRSSVMETARTLTASNIGLQLPNSTWITNANDWFLGETFQLVKYSVPEGHTDAVGSLTDLNGKTASLSPKVLLTQ